VKFEGLSPTKYTQESQPVWFAVNGQPELAYALPAHCPQKSMLKIILWLTNLESMLQVLGPWKLAKGTPNVLGSGVLLVILAGMELRGKNHIRIHDDVHSIA